VEAARKTRGGSQKKMNAMPLEQQNREMFFSLAGQHLNGLYEFVRHQVAYFESLGDLIRGELTPEEVVDAVLVRAYREFVKEPAGREIGSWLSRLATEQLQAEVKRLKSKRDRTIHIEEDIPETPPVEAVTTLGDEILDFYQPDEDLKLEDVFPDIKVPTPEETAQIKELWLCVNRGLAGLPKEWRTALLLRHAEGVGDGQIAKALGKPEPEIARMLEQARAYLRQRLLESGCEFTGSGSKTTSPSTRAGSAKRVAKRGAKG